MWCTPLWEVWRSPLALPGTAMGLGGASPEAHRHAKIQSFTPPWKSWKRLPPHRKAHPAMGGRPWVGGRPIKSYQFSLIFVNFHWGVQNWLKIVKNNFLRFCLFTPLYRCFRLSRVLHAQDLDEIYRLVSKILNFTPCGSVFDRFCVLCCNEDTCHRFSSIFIDFRRFSSIFLDSRRFS